MVTNGSIIRFSCRMLGGQLHQLFIIEITENIPRAGKGLPACGSIHLQHSFPFLCKGNAYL